LDNLIDPVLAYFAKLIHDDFVSEEVSLSIIDQITAEYAERTARKASALARDFTISKQIADQLLTQTIKESIETHVDHIIAKEIQNDMYGMIAELVATEVKDKKVRKRELMMKHAEYESTWMAQEFLDKLWTTDVN
jgi:Glu-tRNA(Gln) amidotransferase subunit E-like FAD-binding protein